MPAGALRIIARSEERLFKYVDIVPSACSVYCRELSTLLSIDSNISP